MRLGDELRKARLARKLTASQVAAATRMKVQVVESMEREDFSGIAAPIYCKGFIRLYAEYVGLDPKPLIEDFVNRLSQPRRPDAGVDVIDAGAGPEPGQETRSEPEPEPAPVAEPEPVVSAREPGPVTPAAAAAPAAESDLDLFAHAARRVVRPEPEQKPEPVIPVTDPVAARPAPKAEVSAGEAGRSPEPASAVRWKEAGATAGWKQAAGRVKGGVAVAVARVLDLFTRPRRTARRWSRAASAAPAAPTATDFEPLEPRRVVQARPLLPVVSVVIGILVILVFVLSGISRYVRQRNAQSAVSSAGEEVFRPVVEPPPPYVN